MTGPEMVPVDWRPRCGKCARFVSDDNIGTVYTPYGKDLQFDGFTDLCRCSQCGMQEVAWTPTRWAVAEPYGAALDDVWGAS